MKRIIILFFCIALGINISCKKDTLDTFETPSSIYLQNSEIKDHDAFSFGYVSSYVRDSIVRLIVSTTGMPVDYERPYRLDIADSSNMEEERDYKFLNTSFSIKPQQLKDTILLKIIRSEEMTKDTLGIYMELKENEHFNTNLNHQTIGTGENSYLRYFTRYSLDVDDIAGVPWFWNPKLNPTGSLFINYLGVFSAKKFQLMIGRYDLDAEELTKVNYRPATTSMLAWANGMQVYLNEMKANGTPVLEEDGTPMVMGVFVQ